ncbi:MAG: hypothetical protein ACYC6Y_19840, partial [Thermoguttaceae bacterium]
VCEYQEVEVECWDVKCTEYCLPIPVLGTGLCGDHCECGQCRPDVTCGHLRAKKSLMLRTVKVKKPVYKQEARIAATASATLPSWR